MQKVHALCASKKPGLIPASVPALVPALSLLLALLCALGVPTPAWSARPAASPALVQGTVTQVMAGDTLLFQPDGQTALTVKLHGIDAPEPCQPWGAQARQALADAALRKPATLRLQGRDGQGRLLGDVRVDGELELGRHLVEEGHAWSIRVRWDQGPLVKQERMAHALRRGLHGAGGAVMPRDFRQMHGPCAAGEPVAAPAQAQVRQPGAPPLPAAVLAVPAAPARLASPVRVRTPARCDGRTRCTQMHSCEEAEYFLAHCPGVEMDGDGDGVPCERQWCSDADEGRQRR